MRDYCLIIGMTVATCVAQGQPISVNLTNGSTLEYEALSVRSIHHTSDSVQIYFWNEAPILLSYADIGNISFGDFTTEVNSVNAESDVNVYPNPAYDNIMIDFGKLRPEHVKVRNSQGLLIRYFPASS